MAQTLADIAPDDIIWGDSAAVQPPANNDWLTSAPRVALHDVDPADIDWWDMGRWRDRTLAESAQKTIGEAGNAVRRGLALSRLASEMEQPAPDPAKIIEIQREIAQNPPSAEFQTVMNDKATPQESWSAFTRNPVGVVNELMLDSLSSYASQMFEKAPARIAIGTGAGVAIGTPAFGIGAIPAGATGALAGFAQSGGAASYSLEMAGGVLESLEQAGVNMGNPEELGAALQDEQRMQVAREFAQKKAIPVAAFDTVSALIAGRVMGAKPATVLAKLGKGVVETAIQSVLGMGGEAAGQISQSGEITSIRQIGAEGLGEIAPGMIEVGVGTGVQALQGQQPSATAPASAPAAATAPFVPPQEADKVVIQETFGDPTTAASETETSTEGTTASVPMMITRQMEADLRARGFSQEDINAMTPQQANDILATPPEVVEEPSAPIVTEPPAAPRFQFDLSDDTTTAPEVDAEADVFAGVPQQQPSGPQSGIDVSQETDGGSTPPGSMATTARVTQDPAIVPSFEQDIVAASEVKDAKGRSVVATEKSVAKMSDEKLMIAYGGASMAFENGGDSPLLRVNVARWHNELVKRGLIQPIPQIVAYAQPAPASSPQAALPQRRYVSMAKFIKEAGDELGEVLANAYADMEVNEDGDALVGYSDTRNSMYRGRIPVREFFDWLHSDRVMEGMTFSKEYKPATEGEGADHTRESYQALIERLREISSPTTPDTPAKRSRRRIKNMTAQSGAIDLSIVEDLVEYGKTVYRAGMDYATWAAAMLKEFGQAVADYLRQAFDRIVQAYKDSPYSDTTGAVGDVRPKQKPRRFEQRVSQAESVSQETKDLIGNDMYEVLRLEPLSQEAAARLAEIGVDAAERSILLLADPKAVATPLDFAIAQHLQINLDATGFPARAAAVTRIISQKATSFGQTISTLKMFARLSPEGVVQYANQTIEEHINSLPPERQQQIRASQDAMAQAEKDLATTRKRTAEDSIINGTQGGEKIQEKLKRRIKDKTQKQRTNVSIRSVLTSQATKAEATKQITQILVDSGISQSEATALATAITSRFYTVLENARKTMAANLKPRSGKGRMTAEKLASQLRDGKLSDQDFISALTKMVGLPAMTPAARAELLKLANEYKAATDDDIRLVTAGKIFERIHELVPPDFWAKVRTFRIIMMLFSPKTWARNIGGNVVQLTLNVGADSIVNGFVDPALTAGKAAYLRARGKTPEQIAAVAKRTSAFGKTGRLKALLTPISDLKKGYLWNQQNNPTANWWDNSKAALDHLRVLSKLTTQNKFEMSDIKDVGRRVFSNPFLAFLEGTTSIVLGGPDRGFWMANYRASLAQREAAAKLNGEWVGFHSPEDIEGAQADAMAGIYQQKNSISDLGVGIRTELNKFSTRWAAKVIPGMTETTQYGLGSMLVTFAQVPGALARTAINWSPLGTVNALYSSMNGILWKTSKQRIGKPFNQAEFNKAFTQALGGTGIYIAGYWLYAMGIITASQEEDKDLEAMRKALGMGQYSINLSALKRMLLSGNIWTRQPTLKDDAIYRYDWLQPVAITFAAGAELAKMVEDNDRAGVKKGLAAKAGMAAISLAAGAKSLEDLPLLSGLSSFMRTWGNEGMLAAVVKTVASEPSAFVPQLVRQANQLNNNLIRETRGGDSGVLRAFNQLAANTPGVSDSYPVRFDITGTPVERYQRNSNTLFNVLVSPATRNYGRVDPALAEVQRLMNVTGSTEPIPREVERTTEINGKTVYLTNEQMSAYQYYVGNYTMSMFNWRMNSPRYVALPDEQKVKILVQDLTDVHAATKSALFGHDIRRLTRRQRVMRNNLANSPLGQSMPPR